KQKTHFLLHLQGPLPKLKLPALFRTRSAMPPASCCSKYFSHQKPDARSHLSPNQSAKAPEPESYFSITPRRLSQSKPAPTRSPPEWRPVLEINFESL